MRYRHKVIQLAIGTIGGTMVFFSLVMTAKSENIGDSYRYGLAPSAKAARVKGLKEIENLLRRWNDLYPKDIFNFYLREPILVPNEASNKGTLRGLKLWELMQRIGSFGQGGERNQVKKAYKFLKSVQKVIDQQKGFVKKIDATLQETLISSPQMTQYFRPGQPLAGFAEKGISERKTELMRYLRKQELFLWLLSKKVIRRTWSQTWSESHLVESEIVLLPDQEVLGDLKDHFGLVGHRGIFFRWNKGLVEGYQKEISYLKSEEENSLEEFLSKNPALLVQLFQISLETKRPLSDEILETIPQVASQIDLRAIPQQTYASLLEIFRSPNPSLALIPMTVYGLISALIPEVSNIELVANAEDTEHLYTVDVHTLQAMQFLWDILFSSAQTLEARDEKEDNYIAQLYGFHVFESQLGLAHEVPPELVGSEEFYHWRGVLSEAARVVVQEDGVLLPLAIYFHDVGKPTYGDKDHDFIGAYQRLPFALERLGGNGDHLLEKLQWLIWNSERVMRLPRQKTVDDLAALQLTKNAPAETEFSKLRLTLALVLLSYVDKKAVSLSSDHGDLAIVGYICEQLLLRLRGPKFDAKQWGIQQEKQLKLDVEEALRYRASSNKEDPTKYLDALEAFFKIMPIEGRVGKSDDTLAQDVMLLHRVMNGESLLVKIRPQHGTFVEMLILHSRDQRGFLSKVSGAFASHQWNIQTAQINTGAEWIDSEGVKHERVFNRFEIALTRSAWERYHEKWSELEELLTEEIQSLIDGKRAVWDLFDSHGVPYEFPILQKSLGVSDPLIRASVKFEGPFTPGSKRGTRFELTANDRIGLMHIVARIVDEVFGGNFQGAPEVGTVGLRIRDNFEIDINGAPLTSEEEELLRANLVHSLNQVRAKLPRRPLRHWRRGGKVDLDGAKAFENSL